MLVWFLRAWASLLVLAAGAVGGRDVDLQLRLERERVFLLLAGSQLCELELVAEGGGDDVRWDRVCELF